MAFSARSAAAGETTLITWRKGTPASLSALKAASSSVHFRIARLGTSFQPGTTSPLSARCEASARTRATQAVIEFGFVENAGKVVVGQAADDFLRNWIEGGLGGERGPIGEGPAFAGADAPAAPVAGDLGRVAFGDALDRGLEHVDAPLVKLDRLKRLAIWRGARRSAAG